MSECKFAEKVSGVSEIQHGRRCKLDGLMCFHYDKPKLFKKCPTLLSKESILGDVTPSVGYPGAPHTFVGRRGRLTIARKRLGRVDSGGE